MKIFGLSGLVLGILAVAGVLFLILSKEKTGFIDATKVFAEFPMKKELETELKSTEKTRTMILDSLKLNLKLQYDALQGEKNPNKESIAKYRETEQQYFLKERQFGEENQNMSEQYTAQVWQQLNQYIQEYGEQNGYDYIYGVTGDGNLMYAKKGNDVTTEVLEFVNSRYNGKK